jgi:hypothetical protein
LELSHASNLGASSSKNSALLMPQKSKPNRFASCLMIDEYCNLLVFKQTA